MRLFWEADLRLPTVRAVHMGCYVRDRCRKGKAWFVELPPELRTSGQYARPTVRLVVDLVKLRKTSAEAPRSSRRRCSTRRRWTPARSSGGSARRRSPPVGSGTDPIANRQLDYALLDHAATEADVGAFCRRLRTAGFVPTLVVTDGSRLYPPRIAAVWPEAEHQRCVFHFVEQVNVGAPTRLLGRVRYDTGATEAKARPTEEARASASRRSQAGQPRSGEGRALPVPRQGYQRSNHALATLLRDRPRTPRDLPLLQRRISVMIAEEVRAAH